MLIDHRHYRVKPGTLQPQLDLYEQYGFKPQTKHLGEPLAYLYTESGEINSIVHLWAYEDATDRANKRAVMAKDPEWHEYLRRNAEAGYLVDQRTNLMLPAKFAPVKR